MIFIREFIEMVRSIAETPQCRVNIIDPGIIVIQLIISHLSLPPPNIEEMTSLANVVHEIA